MFSDVLQPFMLLVDITVAQTLLSDRFGCKTILSSNET